MITIACAMGYSSVKVRSICGDIPAGVISLRRANAPPVNAIVSNVPGPRGPIYILGAPVVELCSIAEPADRHALRVSALSCDGKMQFGVCTDPDAIAELGELAEAIDEAIDELQMRC